jgi:hypothetical protein
MIRFSDVISLLHLQNSRRLSLRETLQTLKSSGILNRWLAKWPTIFDAPDNMWPYSQHRVFFQPQADEHHNFFILTPRICITQLTISKRFVEGESVGADRIMAKLQLGSHFKIHVVVVSFYFALDNPFFSCRFNKVTR